MCVVIMLTNKMDKSYFFPHIPFHPGFWGAWGYINYFLIGQHFSCRTPELEASEKAAIKIYNQPLS